MNYKIFYLYALILISCSNQTEKLFINDVIRLQKTEEINSGNIKYKEILENYINLSTPKHDEKLRIINGLIISNILDTLKIPDFENEHVIEISSPIFEYKNDLENNKKYKLLKAPQLNRWINISSPKCYWISLQDDQIIRLKKLLKRSHLYKGKVDSKWDNEILKAVKLYELLHVNNSSNQIISSLNKSVEQYTLYKLGLINESDMKLSPFSPTISKMKKRMNLKLKSMGYKIDKEGLKQFAKDHNLSEINIFTICQKLNIKEKLVYSHDCK